MRREETTKTRRKMVIALIGLSLPSSCLRGLSSFLLLFVSSWFADLDVEVERELPRMRAQPNRINFVLPLVLDPCLDQVLGEDVAFEKECVIGLQGIEHFIERARKLFDLRRFLRRPLFAFFVSSWFIFFSSFLRGSFLREAERKTRNTKREREEKRPRRHEEKW
jgi:hypothetical protein